MKTHYFIINHPGLYEDKAEAEDIARNEAITTGQETFVYQAVKCFKVTTEVKEMDLLQEQKIRDLTSSLNDRNKIQIEFNPDTKRAEQFIPCPSCTPWTCPTPKKCVFSHKY